MKILRLNLIAFGPFEQTVLDLAEGTEGLHVIYGPNEAGKSSALRALRQMLYGIPARSPDDFRHPYSKLRIGGTLQRSDGARLEIIRRKGRTKTLRGPDDIQAVDDVRLRTFLGGVDEDQFTTMFGIDHPTLVRGGAEIVQGGGNVGQILFSAGSGIADFRKIQSALLSEADDLFKPSAQKPRINEAIQRLKETQREMRESQLTGQAWEEHDRALREALEQKQSVEQQLERKVAERHRLERIASALPVIARRKELLKEYEACRDAPVLPPHFRKKRAEAFESLRIAENLEQQADGHLKEIRANLEGLDVPLPLLAKAELVEELYQELGSHHKAMRDRLRLEGLRSSARSDAHEILRGLHPEMSLDEAERLRLEKAATVRIQELGGTYERLVARQESTAGEMEKLTRHMDRLREQMAATPAIRETDALQRAVVTSRQFGDLDSQYRDACLELKKLETAAAESLERLPLWKGELDDLARLPVPPAETIETFDLRLGNAQETLARKQTELDDLERSLLDLEARIEELRLTREVPTEADVTAAREQRNRGWQLIRRVWEKGENAGNETDSFQADFPKAETLADAYDLSVQQADALADRLWREADRVAKKANLLADRESRKAHRERLRGQIETAEAELAGLQAAWQAAWEPADISPRSPREMRGWLQQQTALTAQAAAARDQSARVADLKSRILSLRRELDRCLTDLEEPGAEERESLTRLIRRGEQVMERFEKNRNQRKQLQSDMDQREDELQDARSRYSSTEQALSEWREKWTGAIAPLGLTADATPGQAGAVVDDLKNLFVKLKEDDVLRKRIEGIDRDAQRFAEKVRELARTDAPGLMDTAVEQAAAELHSRLTRARAARAQQESLTRQALQEEEQLRKAQRQKGEVQAQLTAMCAEAGTERYEDLPAAEERAEQRARIEEQIGQAEARLREWSGGAVLENFIRDAGQVDPDTIAPQTERLTEEIDALHLQKSELDQTIGSERTELDRMDGSARAAEMAEESQSIIARLEGDVDQYVRLRLASAVLNQAIERYREKNQGPILTRASELFSRMTIGSFQSLRLEFDDKGDAVLVGVRSGTGDLVYMEGMSEGTADQLYLAVRLASLESYLEKNEPLPFVVDDILIKFDDERSVATLQILSEMSRRTQIIFFTHHRHLVELAERNVNGGTFFPHALM